METVYTRTTICCLPIDVVDLQEYIWIHRCTVTPLQRSEQVVETKTEQKEE